MLNKLTRSVSEGLAKLLCLAFLLGVLGDQAASAADRIVLRNLEIISSGTVSSFDEDGVVMSDGKKIGWDEIERGRVSPAQQAAFDQMHQDLGDHLYRIRQRLSTGDYAGILPHAEAVYPRYVGRDSATAYMVFQGLMWARNATGKREAAVEPYLRCYVYLRSRNASVTLPGQRRLQFDRKTGMCPELPPIWFDAQAAQQSLAGVYQTVATMPTPRPEGTRIYYGTLAVAAGQDERGEAVLRGVRDEVPLMIELKQIGLAQLEVQRRIHNGALIHLDSQLNSFSLANRPLAIYWLGMSKLTDAEAARRQAGILELMQLPAVFGSVYPDLAAAGLYQAMKVYEQETQSESQAALRKELLTHYSQTYHAAKLRSELSPGDDS